MRARVIVLPFDRLRRAAASAQSTRASQAASATLRAATSRLQFWRGASGRAYPYTVYSLEECPPLPAAGYVLVRRDAKGRGSALAVGRVTQPATHRNLDAVRRLATCLGADEVHVHFPTAATADLAAVERDVAATGLVMPLAASLSCAPTAGRA